MALDSILDFGDEILKVFLHLHRHVVRVEATFMGIGDDGRLAVVGRHDNKAVRGVEDIEGDSIFVRWISGDELQIVAFHKLGGNGLGCLQVNGVSD